MSRLWGSSTLEITSLLNHLVEPDHTETAAMLTCPKVMQKSGCAYNVLKLSLMFMERAIPEQLLS